MACSSPCDRPPLSQMQMTWRNLAAGGLSCAISSALLNFNDHIKVRLQIQGATGITHGKHMGYVEMALHIVRTEGTSALFLRGMTASMIRELTYSSVRMGLYEPFRDFVANGDKKSSLATKLFAGLCSGALGSAFVNPADLIKVRFQAERRVHGANPRYRHTWHALKEIYRHEGFRVGLYRGVEPTIVRAAFLTSAQLATYDHCKHWMIAHAVLPEGPAAHVVASLLAAVAACTAANPADVIKTRIMHDVAHGHSHYRGVWHCLSKTVHEEGVRALFKGWLPSYYRLGPHFVLSLPLFEWLRAQFGLPPV